MRRAIGLVMVGGMAFAGLTAARAQALNDQASRDSLRSGNPPANVGALPPLPRGKSTILGGEIRNVDPVLDRFTLNVVGLKPMRIYFDERTQFFVDGKKMSLRKLTASDHASIQTASDGASIFAISIHILSHSTPGDIQGEVQSYNPATGDLQLAFTAGGEPLQLTVARETEFNRKGQGTFASAQSGPSDLQKGALVSVQFDSDNRGHGTATKITLLATPGAEFVFSGNATAIDMRSGRLLLTDPRDERTYQISFDSASIPGFQNVHPGQNIRVTANYNGISYIARDVTVY